MISMISIALRPEPVEGAELDLIDVAGGEGNVNSEKGQGAKVKGQK